MNTEPIRFYHRGQIVEVQGAHPTRSVLDWLRDDAHCTGTKEGCNEGDCGACTVVVGRLASEGEGAGLQLQTVNACMKFLPTLDGKALFSVEDLKELAARPATAPVEGAPAPQPVRHGAVPAASALHPVQQAMVECHGSQCGFCTPGFVMSLWSTYERHQADGTRPSRQQLADDLSGNLCRCTGYRPILEAGLRMFDLPAVTLDTAPVIAALKSLQRGETVSASGLHYEAPNRQLAKPEGSLAPRTDHFHAPRTLAELASLREQKPAARLLAGGTDIGLWVTKQFRDLGDILYVGEVEEMKRIEVVDGDAGRELRIGAGASLEAAWRELDAQFPSLTDVWLRFASLPIRNAGTMGGNIANGSPIGDSAPVLMALDAQVELRAGARVRRVPLDAFYLGYMKSQLQPGEFVQALTLPLSGVQARQVRAYKISKRFDCDISAVCAGLSLELQGGVVTQVRLAFGGMAATVARARQAEAALQGEPWTQVRVEAAQRALAQDFQPLSDMRASAAYRLQVAQNLLQRFWLETRADDPLPAQATSVWSVMPHASAAAASHAAGAGAPAGGAR